MYKAKVNLVPSLMLSLEVTGTKLSDSTGYQLAMQQVTRLISVNKWDSGSKLGVINSLCENNNGISF